MPGTGGYGAMPGMGGMGMQPGMMGTMPMGGMPPMGMGGMGMRQGGMGYDPEMNAMLAQQLQRLRIQETQLNSEIAMYGGETAPVAQPLLAQRTRLQTQIRDLELQLGISGAGTPAVPGAMGNPMTGMNPGMTQPGMVPPAMTPADMMALGMARQGMPGVPGYGAEMPGMGMMGSDPNRMFFEQQKQEITLELQRVQHQLSFVDANHPMRPILLTEQERLVAQIDSLNKQLGQTQTPGGTMPGPGIPGATPGAAGSNVRSLTDLTTPAAPLARTNTAITPEIAQMMNAEQHFRASGQIAYADELKAMIEKQQTGGFIEPMLPASMPMNPAVLPPAMPLTLPQQAELAELRSTVDSLRGEIASMREEIRALNVMLRRWDQTTEPNGMIETTTPNDTIEVFPNTPMPSEFLPTE